MGDVFDCRQRVNSADIQNKKRPKFRHHRREDPAASARKRGQFMKSHSLATYLAMNIVRLL